jgi:hypothetical protein
VWLSSNKWYQGEVREMSTSSEMPGNKKGSSDGAPCPVVVERIIAAALEFPKLVKGNYHEWALMMKVNLEAMSLWNVVESDSVEHHIDRMALAAILHAVPAEMKSSITEKKSTKEVWTTVKTMRLGGERMRAANAQKLFGAFKNMKFHDGESISEFAMCLNSLASELHALSEKIGEVWLINKMLRVIPKH